MKVMLINPNRLKHPWPVIPFGLCCVAAALEKEGHDIRVLDLCFSENPATDISSKIENFQPDVVGISIRNIDNASGAEPLFMLQQIKDEVIVPCQKTFSGPLIIGGSAVGINGEEMLHYFDLTYAIWGDGEAAMVEFINRLEKNLSLDGLRGLIRREKGTIISISVIMHQKDTVSTGYDFNFLPVIMSKE